MNQWLDRAEKTFAVFAIFYYTTCLFSIVTGQAFVDPLILEATETVEESNALLSLIQWSVFGITLLLSGLHWKHFVKVLSQRKAIWGVVILAIVSVMWSIVPDLTIRRSIALLMSTLLGMYLAMRFSIKELMYLIAIALGLTAIVNAAFTLAFPAFGTEARAVHVGAWKGVLSHKNNLARLMVLSSLNFLLLLPESRKHRIWIFSGLVLSVAMVLLTTSKTGLSILGFTIVLIPLFRSLRWRYTIALPAFISLFLVIAIITIWFVGNQELVFTALGRDATLTGRTDIWEVASEKISQRFWLGYGYKSFWLGKKGESIDVFYRMNWQSPNGHNGYLDLLLDLGFLGFASFALSFAMGFRRSLVWLRLNPGVEGLWPIACLSYLLLYNVTESSLILDPTNIFWLIYTIATTAILIQPIKLDSSLDQARVT